MSQPLKRFREVAFNVFRETYYPMLYNMLLRLSSTYRFAVAEMKECGSIVNNTLTSPGYPNNYPSNMDCFYLLPIPHGMAMIITFREFHMEYSSRCRYVNKYKTKVLPLNGKKGS